MERLKIIGFRMPDPTTVLSSFDFNDNAVETNGKSYHLLRHRSEVERASNRCSPPQYLALQRYDP